MKKRLLVVMEAVQTNGAVLGWFGYIEAILKGGWEVDVFLFDPSARDGLALPAGVRILHADIHCMMARLSLSEALVCALRKGRLDLFLKRLLFSVLQKYSKRFRKWNLLSSAKRISQSYDVAIAATLGGTWKFLMEKVSASTKLLWVNTDVRNTTWSPWWHAFKHYVEDAHGLVCVSKAMRDQMRKDNPQWAEKIFALNYVVDVEAILKKSEAPCPYEKKTALRLVTVGRYSPEKGQYLIPAMAERIKWAGVDFEWYVIAPGSSAQKEKIDQEIKSRGVEGMVMVTEGMSNPFPMVKSADISVQPSLFEGFGLTVSEAMILGAYVVASDIPSFREQIVSDELGLFAEKRDVESFAAAILIAIDRVRSGKTCTDYQSPYSRSNTYRQFVDIVENAVCARS